MFVTPRVARTALAGMAALVLAGGAAYAGGMPPEIEIDANGVPIESDAAATSAAMLDDGLAPSPVAASAAPLETIIAAAGIAAEEPRASQDPQDAQAMPPAREPFAMKEDRR